MDASKTPTLAFADIDYSLILFVLAALLIGGGGSYYIMKTERLVMAAGFFIASLTIFIYFGLRWFDGMKLRQSMSGVVDPTTAWPPVINYCPDFMSLKKLGSGDTATYYCVDTMGITRLPRYTQDSSLITSASNGTVNNIPLIKTNTAQTYATSIMGGGNTAGATWEGVYDGRTASNIIPPYPTA
jgi:hypothetical protein